MQNIIISRQNQFFRIFGKTGSRIRIFFGLKPSPDQTGANKKKFSQIGPAVPQEIGHKHTSKHTNIVLLYNREVSIIIHASYVKLGVEKWKGLLLL